MPAFTWDSSTDEILVLVFEEGGVDGALAKDHDVLREGAGLVGEQELHVAKLLVQVTGVALGGLWTKKGEVRLVVKSKYSVPSCFH